MIFYAVKNVTQNYFTENLYLLSSLVKTFYAASTFIRLKFLFWSYYFLQQKHKYSSNDSRCFSSGTLLHFFGGLSLSDFVAEQKFEKIPVNLI